MTATIEVHDVTPTPQKVFKYDLCGLTREEMEVIAIIVNIGGDNHVWDSVSNLEDARDSLFNLIYNNEQSLFDKGRTVSMEIIAKFGSN